jgi:hypothetical protein
VLRVPFLQNKPCHPKLKGSATHPEITAVPPAVSVSSRMENSKPYKLRVVINALCCFINQILANNIRYYLEIKYQLDATDEFLLQICCCSSPQTGHTTHTLELLMIGIMVPETC